MIAVKGFREGLLIVFNGGAEQPWDQHLHLLRQRLDSAPGFFKGGRVALDVKTLALSEQHLREALRLLHSYEMDVWAVRSDCPQTRASARAIGLLDTLSPPADARAADLSTNSADQASAGTSDKQAMVESSPATDALESDDSGGLFVRRRVRSGQSLRHPGYIVVLGDVNPGAQIIAGGDIIVWGRLQGTVHAGALGNCQAVVCALAMSPALVRIADAVGRPPAVTAGKSRKRGGARSKAGAQIARLCEGEIVFAPWDV